MTAGKGRVLVADDIQANRELLTGLLTRDGYTVSTAADGQAALDMIGQEAPDLVLSDVIMPGLSGFDLCRRLKADPATRLLPIVLITSLSEREDRIEGINAGADDFLSKPVDAHELKARVRSLVRLKRLADALDATEAAIVRLAIAVEARDPYTTGHCDRMAAYAAAFGRHLDVSDREVDALHRGGYLHDVGKIGIPDAVLLNPVRYTADDRRAMQQHTTIGDALCADVPSLHLVRPIVRHHHERVDGSGYPDGLAADRIPLLAQLTGIVDVYDALTNDRPYRGALSIDAACAELRDEAARGLHRADLVAEFIGMVQSGRLAEIAR